MLSTERLEAIRMIQESAAAFVPKGDLQRIRQLRFGASGFDRSTWKQMCDLGWSGLRVPEARGGSGLGILEFCKIAEQLGSALVPEPYIASAVARLLDDATLGKV